MIAVHSDGIVFPLFIVRVVNVFYGNGDIMKHLVVVTSFYDNDDKLKQLVVLVVIVVAVVLVVVIFSLRIHVENNSLFLPAAISFHDNIDNCFRYILLRQQRQLFCEWRSWRAHITVVVEQLYRSLSIYFDWHHRKNNVQ